MNVSQSSQVGTLESKGFFEGPKQISSQDKDVKSSIHGIVDVGMSADCPLMSFCLDFYDCRM